MVLLVTRQRRLYRHSKRHRQEKYITNPIFSLVAKIAVLFSACQVPRAGVWRDSEWERGSSKSLAEGVIKADYGEAEGRAGQHICLRHLMRGG